MSRDNVITQAESLCVTLHTTGLYIKTSHLQTTICAKHMLKIALSVKVKLLQETIH